MDLTLFEKYSGMIRNSAETAFSESAAPDERFLLGRDGNVSVFYAPFEYMNAQARVVLVGITPGKTQMNNALREARQQLLAGADLQIALRAAKKIGAFSGPMRSNLIAMLDHIGIGRWLGIQSCTELFRDTSNLAQTASVLRYPVFVNGKDYNGTPAMLTHPYLRKCLLEYFGKDIEQIRNAVFVPLGDKVAEVLHFLAQRGLLDSDKVLDGLPHPSGANAERIAYFLGAKPKELLSSKTNAGKIDSARERLQARVLALG